MARGTTSYDSRMRPFWKQIWQLNNPHKVRHFVWRACKDSLPTKENLVLADGCCEFCNSSADSSIHLFWDYNRVRDVWNNLKIFHMQMPFCFHSFMDMEWYGVVEAEQDEEQIEKMVMVTWSLWLSINEFWIGGMKNNALRIGSDALEYLAEYQDCVKEPMHSQVVQSGQREVWKPPPRNLFKINIDGVVFTDQKAAGVGVLIRDE